jgi:Spy/CpxP family protein refolding chaperone
MCHAFGRESRHHHSFHSIHSPEQHEHDERREDHARRHRGARRVCFMPHHEHHHDWDRSEGRSGLGVRRPLRFLAHKLDLDDRQVAELARILTDLKTERAQADVDERRSLAEFADAVAGAVFDSAKAASAGERRVQSASKVRETLNRALEQIHALLNAEQRESLAYLIRTGVLSL